MRNLALKSQRAAFVSMGLLLIMSGCAGIEDVPAWERCYLAKTGMQWDNFPREGRLAGHVYTSKEASSGGAKAAGGGCGCN